MISVIVLTYNGEKYIRRCLDSVISQTIGMNQIEIIIIDDASVDSTVDILREYEKLYPENICLILREENSLGTGEVNRNIGLEYATGEYILFLDQDDWYELNAFEILIDVVKKNPQIDYIEFRFNYTDIDENIYKVSRKLGEGVSIFDIQDEDTRIDYAKRYILPGATFVWNKIYRKRFLQENVIVCNDGERRTGFTDNFFSGLVVMYVTHMARINLPLYNYRNYIGSYSHDAKKNSKVQFERCKVAIVFLDECRRRGLYDLNKEMVEFIFMRTFLLKTFWKFLLQYEPIPYDTLQYIQEEMLKQCPQYMQNSIIVHRRDTRLVVEILDKIWTREFLDILSKEMSEVADKSDIKKYLYLS